MKEILDQPIRELGLKLEGSPLQPFVDRLYREMEQKGLEKFHPAVYLTDEWGCPSGEPVIGIPFYLARPDLAALEKENNDLEDAREIMMYLRHEAGHAFNYAYRLHRMPEWKQLFGRFAGRITIITGRSLSRRIMCGTWPDGMRKNIRMKTLRKPLRFG